ncbi:MAG: CBS domain-containing protein [Thermoanaerobaculia bacterium]|nr:CBS domain-containing protein [Thermoanaerobaculia bacterium]
MKARDLMTPNPKTCAPDHELTCAIRIMKEEDVGIVPITEGNGDARVVGVVTDRDVALHLGDRDKKPSEVRVSDVMTRRVVAVEPNADVSDVSRKMQEAQVRRVLVVENGTLSGVIATADLARASSSSSRDRVGEEVERVMEKVSEENRDRR